MFVLTRFNGTVLRPEGSTHDVSGGGLIAPLLTGVGGRAFEAFASQPVGSASSILEGGAEQGERDIVYKAIYAGATAGELGDRMREIKKHLGVLAPLERTVLSADDNVIPTPWRDHEIMARMLDFDAAYSGKSPLVSEVSIPFRLTRPYWSGFERTVSITVDANDNVSSRVSEFAPHAGNGFIQDVTIDIDTNGLNAPCDLYIGSDGGHSLLASLEPPAGPFSGYRVESAARKSIQTSSFPTITLDSYATLRPGPNHRSRDWFGVGPSSGSNGGSVWVEIVSAVTGSVTVTFSYRDAWI